MMTRFCYLTYILGILISSCSVDSLDQFNYTLSEEPNNFFLNALDSYTMEDKLEAFQKGIRVVEFEKITPSFDDSSTPYQKTITNDVQYPTFTKTNIQRKVYQFQLQKSTLLQLSIEENQPDIDLYLTTSTSRKEHTAQPKNLIGYIFHNNQNADWLEILVEPGLYFLVLDQKSNTPSTDIHLEAKNPALPLPKCRTIDIESSNGVSDPIPYSPPSMISKAISLTYDKTVITSGQHHIEFEVYLPKGQAIAMETLIQQDTHDNYTNRGMRVTIDEQGWVTTQTQGTTHHLPKPLLQNMWAKISFNIDLDMQKITVKINQQIIAQAPMESSLTDAAISQNTFYGIQLKAQSDPINWKVKNGCYQLIEKQRSNHDKKYGKADRPYWRRSL